MPLPKPEKQEKKPLKINYLLLTGVALIGFAAYMIGMNSFYLMAAYISAPIILLNIGITMAYVELRQRKKLDK